MWNGCQKSRPRPAELPLPLSSKNKPVAIWGWLAVAIWGWLPVAIWGWLAVAIWGWLAVAIWGWLAVAIWGWLAVAIWGWLAVAIWGWLEGSTEELRTTVYFIENINIPIWIMTKEHLNAGEMLCYCSNKELTLFDWILCLWIRLDVFQRVFMILRFHSTHVQNSFW